MKEVFIHILVLGAMHTRARRHYSTKTHTPHNYSKQTMRKDSVISARTHLHGCHALAHLLNRREGE
jgi:hypothetical protein